jgi:peptide/nickel transport system ATP-binding protein
VRVPAGKGLRGSDVATVLDRLRAEHRDEPLWRGVRRITADDGGAQVEFHDPIEPRLLPVGDVEVECHLHDPEALAEAERRRAGNDEGPVEDRAL